MIDRDDTRWCRPIGSQKISRLDVLQKRHVIRRAVRAYLDGQNFIELDVPLLVRGTTPDVAVESFKVGDRYLATSTEYQLKRLAIGGIEKLYTLTQNFRPGDNSTFRNPEFTMLEWGRVGKDMRAIMADAEALTYAAVKALGLNDKITYQGQSIEMCLPWERLSVADAIERITGVAMADFEIDACRKAATAAGMEIHSSFANDRDFMFSLLMDHIQPKLGAGRPLFLTDWPIYQTTAAATKDAAPIADRAELFIAGIEMSDGFAGLTDYDLQKEAFDQSLLLRKAGGQVDVQLDQHYLQALKIGKVFGAGMAMGFDRLVMLLTDQPHISSVLAFGWDEV